MSKLFHHTFTPFKRGQMTSPQNWGKPKAWNRRAVERERIGVKLPKAVTLEHWGEFVKLMLKTPQLDWVLTVKDFGRHYFEAMPSWAAQVPNSWLVLDWHGCDMDMAQIDMLENLGPTIKGVLVDPFISQIQIDTLSQIYGRFDWLILRGDCRENEPRALWTSWLTPIVALADSGLLNIWLDAFGREFAGRHGLGNPIGADPSEWPDFYKVLRQVPKPTGVPKRPKAQQFEQLSFM